MGLIVGDKVVCPHCGSDNICTTLMGYPSGRDGNHVICSECKWKGTAQDWMDIYELHRRLCSKNNKAVPIIVCLCGSTRFWKEFQRQGLNETMDGKIVLSIGSATGTDDEHFGNLSKVDYDKVRTMLDELHKRKIDIADEVLILNVDGYIGESTRSELEYAKLHNKKIRYLINKE